MLTFLLENSRIRRTLIVCAALGLFGVAGVTSHGGRGIGRIDASFHDQILKLRRRKGPAPVSNQVVFLDIGGSELNSVGDALQEYQHLATYTEQLRDQGCKVVALDVLLQRGGDREFDPLWSQWDDGDVVLGRTWRDVSKTRSSKSNPPAGLVYTPIDYDGIHRRYLLAQPSPDGATSLPSLALAAYLTRQGLRWDPAWLKGDTIEFSDFDDNQSPIQRHLPNEIWLDYRYLWSEENPEALGHVTPKKLQDWQEQSDSLQLEGRTAFLSYTATAFGDVGTTPMEFSVPKVSIHGTAFNDLIQDTWRFRLSTSATVGLMAVTAGLAVLVGGLSGTNAAILWALGVIVLMGAGTASMWSWRCIVPTSSLSLLWTVGVGLEQWFQSRLRTLRESKVTASADMDDPLILKNLGEFRVVEKIGQGGFATVYRAVPIETLDPEQSVAIKIVHESSVTDSEMRRRFLREIRISASLEHPNIVQVIDSGDQNGLLYLVMERLKGRSLRQYLEAEHSQPVDWKSACQLLRSLLGAMVYAHSKNVLHRDLKPENVMLDPHAHKAFEGVKILDFGLAFDDASSRITRASEVAGTFDYLAPERIQGVSDDPRSDQYAIGLMIYELLTGSLPFPKLSMAQSLMLRLSQDCPPLKERRNDLPDDVCQIVDRMIAREPEARFASCQAVLEALNHQG